MNSLFTSSKGKSRSIRLVWLAAACLLFVAGYQMISARTLHAGFPLDDAWIHQTYARNLAELGQWAYFPGQLSAGSTSPLWSLLLAAGYLLRFSPLLWAFLLGGLCLFAISVTGQWAAGFVSQKLDSRIPWIGLFLAGEWHLVWAAASGMETALFGLLILLVIALLLSGQPRWWLVGLLAGIAVWVRPDGLTLLGPALFVAVLTAKNRQQVLKACGQVLGAFCVFFLPYLLFNRLLAGSWWPNTFYAKQAEYAVLTQVNLLRRLVNLFTLPLIGAGVLLLPGMILLVWRAWRERKWAVLAAFLWWAGYTVLYAWRLPVTYQHGRYLMPSMPVYFVLGLAGTVEFLRLNSPAAWQRVASRALAVSIAALSLGFYVAGANSYAQDVAIIETEMVATSRWVAENTPPDSLIAAHDIGALGYFAQRRLLDLAGLISPEIIPFLRDEARLETYLDEQQVQYLITFPGWYPRLILRGQPVYQSTAQFAPANGGENMTVYRWQK